MIGTKSYQTASPPSALILGEDEIRKLTVTKIHEQLDKHRALWKPGMTVLPRNYRLKNKAAKLRALQAAIAEHLRNRRKDSDMDGDTLVPSSSRQSGLGSGGPIIRGEKDLASGVAPDPIPSGLRHTAAVSVPLIGTYHMRL